MKGKTMNQVVDIEDFRRAPHRAEYVACLECGKDWVAVFPADCKGFECPDCLKVAGEIVDHKDFDFFSRFMNSAKDDVDRDHRILVLLNATRI